MTCQEVMEYMQRQLDGDLDERETESLMDHTRHCPDCAAMFERLKRLSSELDNLPKVAPGYSLVDAIMPRLEQIELMQSAQTAADDAIVNTVPRRTPPVRQQRWTERFSFRALSGVIAAGVVIGLFIVTFDSQGMRNADEANSNTMLFSANYNSSGADHSAAASSGAETGNAADNGAIESLSERSSVNDQAGNESRDGTPEPPVSGDAAAVSPDSNGEPDQAGNAAADANDPVVKDVQPEAAAPPKSNQPARPSAPASPAPAPSSPQEGQKDGEASDSVTEPTSDNTNKTRNTNETNKLEKQPEREAPIPDKPEMAADESAQEVPEMGIASEPEQSFGIASIAGPDSEVMSPDGAYNAAIMNNTVKVFDAATGALLFESRNKDGEVVNLVWSEDSRFLSYEVIVQDEAVERYFVDINRAAETKQ
ncbi:anti-sigma factor family protein [Paenibacillus abyssi]|uniref:Anti-sigma-W factor RsiW n=1 Tax=Paenibacillus abyssi TaxID=1340531 RepID=A0A917D542_9BACL|nr:zf-HC2 domain-containing protein [Paenibacillus abyssi]GGG10968.1 hypothetical protein GCM10010916_29780 [Paenibacillus abyssi]